MNSAPIETKNDKKSEFEAEIDMYKRSLKEYGDKIDEFLAILPEIELIEGQEDEWKRIVEVNKDDDYSKAVIDFAENLAKVLQIFKKSGKTLDHDEICAVERFVDSSGITGFMYDAARSVLKRVWPYYSDFYSREE